MGSAEHRYQWLRHRDELYPWFHLVRWQDVARHLGTDVGPLDVPPSAYRPDPYLGVEVSHALHAPDPYGDDSLRGPRLDALIKE